MGNSFIKSMNVRIKAMPNAVLLIGKCIFWKSFSGPKPRFTAVSSKDCGCFSRLDFIGDLPTAKNLITKAYRSKKKDPIRYTELK